MASIAVVDDDPSIRRLLKTAFGREGHQCVPYASASAARQGWQRQTPDLIMLDVSLGDDNGIDVCRRLKGDPALRAVPVILMTGEASAVEQRLQGLGAGADDYVLKPFDIVEVMLRVKAVLGRR